MMMTPTEIQVMRKLVGRRVRLERCCDPYTNLQPGTLGTVHLVDDAGTVHVDWDDGCQLGLCWDDGDIWTLL
jgi:hypothetical protein